MVPGPALCIVNGRNGLRRARAVPEDSAQLDCTDEKWARGKRAGSERAGGGSTLALCLVVEGRAVLLGEGPDGAQKGLRGIGESGVAPVDKAEDPLELELGDLDSDQSAGFQLVGDGEVGDKGDTAAHRHESLDGFNGGELNTHIERGTRALEGFNDLAAEG